MKKVKGKLNIPTRGPQGMQTGVPYSAPSAAPAGQGQAPAGQRPPVIMIAVPAMETVHTEFAQHLAMATAHLTRAGALVTCAFNIGSVITLARRNLVNHFLQSGADYIWWLDSDMKFPIDAGVRLLNRNKDIVGVNYRRRRFPNPTFTAMVGKPGTYTELQTTPNSPPMEAIDVLPHGCVMAKREVYLKVPQPHYLQEYIPELNIELGEDLYFCREAQKAGYTVWCDHELSRECAHIGVFHFNWDLSVPNQ